MKCGGDITNSDAKCVAKRKVIRSHLYPEEKQKRKTKNKNKNKNKNKKQKAKTKNAKRKTKTQNEKRKCKTETLYKTSVTFQFRMYRSREGPKKVTRGP